MPSTCSATQLQYQVLLAAAAQDGALAEVKFLINNEKVDINGGDVFDETPLHWAVSSQNASVVQFLLENGADVNRPHLKTRETPLHRACSAGSLEAVRLLFQFGADGVCLDKVRRSPLQSAIQKCQWHIAQYFIEDQPKILSSCPELCLRITQFGSGRHIGFLLGNPTSGDRTSYGIFAQQRFVSTPRPPYRETALTMACKQRFPDALHAMLRSRPDVWPDVATLLSGKGATDIS